MESADGGYKYKGLGRKINNKSVLEMVAVLWSQ